MRYANNLSLTWEGPLPNAVFMTWLRSDPSVKILHEQVEDTEDSDVNLTVTAVVGDVPRIKAHVQDINVVHITMFWNGRTPPDIGINRYRPKRVDGISPWGYHWDTAIQSGAEDRIPPRPRAWFPITCAVIGIVVIAAAILYRRLH